MATDKALALQAALYSALDAALTVPVYDGAPLNAAYPFVDIGETTVTGDDAKDASMGVHRMTVHVWSRPSGGGQHEAKAIQAQIYNALHRVSTGMAGSGPWVEVMRMCFRDADGETVHGAQDFEVRASH